MRRIHLERLTTVDDGLVAKHVEPIVTADVNPARIRVDRSDADPAILHHLFQRRAGVYYLHETFRRRLDHEEQSHGLVDLHHLPRQSSSQVARVAIHHADEPRHVVRKFGAAPVAIVVDEGEVVLQADARADGNHCGHHCCEALVAGILGGVIGSQEHPAV